MNYSEALGYLKIASQRGSVLGLSRIKKLLELMGDPQERIKTIHVAGTNGKGSFSAMLSNILQSSGYKVGSFSSPFITRINESFCVNSKEISDEGLGEIIGDIAPICESMEEKPTEFEVITAAAFEWFVRKRCDIVILECGMGGDTDSTNVISAPVLSVITNVAKDHCAFLGNSIMEIVKHKSGIIKAECPVLYGGNDLTADGVIINAAEKNHSKLYRTHFERSQNISCDLSGTVFDFGQFKGLKISLLGEYQLYNAANVLTAVEILRSCGIDIDDKAVFKGLKNTKWKGRFELLKKEPCVIFDGAHNPDGIEMAVKSIKRYFPNQKIALLIGVMADKEYGLYADMMSGLTEKVFTVKPDNPRALDSGILAETFFEKGISARAFDKLSDGVLQAYDFAKENNIPLIALGSLYMYKEFCEALKNI